MLAAAADLLCLIVCENAETEWHPHQWQVVPCSLFCSKFPYHDQIMTKLFPHSQLSPSKLIRPSNTQSIKLLNSYLAMHSIWIQPPHWRYGSWTFSMVGGKDVTNAMPRIITHKPLPLHWQLGVKSGILFLKSFIFITALSKHLQCTNLFNCPWIPSCQSISVDELNTHRVTNTLTPTVWYFHTEEKRLSIYTILDELFKVPFRTFRFQTLFFKNLF